MLRTLLVLFIRVSVQAANLSDISGVSDIFKPHRAVNVSSIFSNFLPVITVTTTPSIPHTATPGVATTVAPLTCSTFVCRGRGSLLKADAANIVCSANGCTREWCCVWLTTTSVSGFAAPVIEIIAPCATIGPLPTTTPWATSVRYPTNTPWTTITTPCTTITPGSATIAPCATNAPTPASIPLIATSQSPTTTPCATTTTPSATITPGTSSVYSRITPRATTTLVLTTTPCATSTPCTSTTPCATTALRTTPCTTTTPCATSLPYNYTCEGFACQSVPGYIALWKIYGKTAKDYGCKSTCTLKDCCTCVIDDKSSAVKLYNDKKQAKIQNPLKDQRLALFNVRTIAVMFFSLVLVGLMTWLVWTRRLGLRDPATFSRLAFPAGHIGPSREPRFVDSVVIDESLFEHSPRDVCTQQREDVNGEQHEESGLLPAHVC